MNRSPALHGLFLAAFLAATPSCNYERMVDQEYVRPYETRMPRVPAGAIPTDEGEDRYRWSPRGSLVNPIPSSAASVDRGRLCYEYFCIQCHGTATNGDGTVGQSFSPLPADLRSPAVQRLADDAMFRSISYGTPNGRQPPLFYTVSAEDRWHLINWIRALGERRDPGPPIPSGDYRRSAEAIP